MGTSAREIARALLRTESPWNPKVMAGRAASAMLPDEALHAIKRIYYASLLARLPNDFMERDSLVVSHLVSTGEQVVDVGASIGVYTKFLSKLVGPLGRVWSFEPIKETFDFLSNNVRRLGLTNVQTVNCAISDRDGTEKMVVPTYRWGADCFYDARIASAAVHGRHTPVQPSWKSEGVATTALDSFFGRHESRISFIKCDANFHELACLRGGLATLRYSKPSMLVEIQPDPDDPSTSAFETFALMAAEGYGVYWFDGSALRARRPGERSQNYFFLTPEHVEGLRAKNTVSVLTG